MFNRTTNYRAGDVIVNGVNAPEAARFLNDIEKESSSRIDKVIFDRIDVADIKMEWAVAHEICNINNCHKIAIYYNDGANRRITLDIVEKDVNIFLERGFVIQEIGKDMARRIAEHLIHKMLGTTR